MWYLTMMVKGVGTGAHGNGIAVCLLCFALVTVLWSVAPNSVLFDVLPSAFKQDSSLMWFLVYVGAAQLGAMLSAAMNGPARRWFCPSLGFATAWFAFDLWPSALIAALLRAATVYSSCFQPVLGMQLFVRSPLVWFSGHEVVLLFLVYDVDVMSFLVPGSEKTRILALFLLWSLISGKVSLVTWSLDSKGKCKEKRIFSCFGRTFSHFSQASSVVLLTYDDVVAFRVRGLSKLKDVLGSSVMKGFFAFVASFGRASRFSPVTRLRVPGNRRQDGWTSPARSRSLRQLQQQRQVAHRLW